MRVCLTAKGHANTAEPGHDLVCAAVSSLVYGLAKAVADMDGEKRYKKRVIAGETPGQATVEVVCTDAEMYREVTNYLVPVEKSLLLLMNEYRDAVRVSVVS